MERREQFKRVVTVVPCKSSFTRAQLLVSRFACNFSSLTKTIRKFSRDLFSL
jgi:hypothetical protein